MWMDVGMRVEIGSREVMCEEAEEKRMEFSNIFFATLVLVFFFSSRRRHTRLVSDWSSDVCSSDLERTVGGSVKRFSDMKRA